jgi:hypothetical protein
MKVIFLPALLLFLASTCVPVKATPLDDKLAVLNAQIRQCYQQKNYERANSLFFEVHRLLRSSGDVKATAKAGISHAKLLMQMGKFTSAEVVTEQCFDLLCSAPKPDAETLSLKSTLNDVNYQARKHKAIAKHLFENGPEDVGEHISGLRSHTQAVVNHWQNKETAMKTLHDAHYQAERIINSASSNREREALRDYWERQIGK